MPVKSNNQKGFTLIEVIAATILLGLLLAGAYSILNESTRQVTRSLIAQRAAEVARRQMELLITTRQEPDSTGLETDDLQDPAFSWKMDLKRVPVGEKAATLNNTVIHATVTVSYLGDGKPMEPYELHRFFESLNPKGDNSIAVPLQPAYEQDEFYLKLKEKLGREPTSQELFEAMMQMQDQ